MSEKTQKIKKHFVDHKEAYIIGGACLIAGVAIGIISKGVVDNPEIEVAPKITQLLSWKPEATQNIVIEIVERSTPSKPVHLVGTNLFFDSMSDAARKTGHSVSDISKNVRGIRPNIKGDVFELLEKAS